MHAATARHITSVIQATALTAARNKIFTIGPIFYLLVWASLPIFEVLTIGFIYQNNRSLLEYAVVAGSGVAFIFAMLFNGSEAMDVERRRGTLGNLFVAPASRYAWLAGFQLFSIAEAFFTAAVTMTLGALVFGISFSVNPITALVVLLLFIPCTWGISIAVGAVGVAFRNSNQLSNLFFPMVTLVAGTMYPLALMPDWLRIPAQFLPFGHAMQAMVDALTANAAVTELWHHLLPLTAFAAVLPALGMLAFRALERRARISGSLEVI